MRIFVFFVLTSIALQAAFAERPNIVLIIADDIATYDLGAYGNKKVQSPHIDELARSGMRFDNAFVTISSCSPSRASIITGRYPHNTGAEQLHWPLPATQTTFVELLKAAGYWTGAAGKWHLGDEIKDRFDEVREADESGYQMPAGATDGFAETMQGESRSGSDQWVPLLKSRPKDRPFFLWLASLDAHRPYSEKIIPKPHSPADVFVPPFMLDTPEVRHELALYYDEITRFDHYVDLVRQELIAQGVADNTLILIMSDNGQPFVRAKVTLYDSGIKTPMIVHWPRGVPAGQVSSSLVSAVDLAPTFLELAGVPVPPSMEGISFTAQLKDPAAITRHYVYAEKHWHDYEDEVRAVASKKYKYIRNLLPNLPNTPSADGVRSPSYQLARGLFAAGKLTPAQAAMFIVPRPVDELYDRVADPFETKNLAKDPAYAAALAEMKQALAEWQKATGDVFPAKRTPDEFDRNTGDALPTRQRPRPSKAQMIEAGIIDR